MTKFEVLGIQLSLLLAKRNLESGEVGVAIQQIEDSIKMLDELQGDKERVDVNE